MKKTKEELYGVIDRKLRREKYNLMDMTYEIEDRYGVPVDISSDILTGRKPAAGFSDFVMFTITDCSFQDLIGRFFTDTEIATYRKKKYSTDSVEFPIEFRMVQIDFDQWIGKIDSKLLMELGDAQLIHYNENTQRTLTVTIRGGEKKYKITVNKRAVDQIEQSYLSGEYIPNTITLRLPETADFHYDNETGKLIIKSTDNFDIIDGYHRYLALQRIHCNDPEFNYPMELRIVCCDDTKARQLIWQEDQKTKMKKVDSDSYNKNDQAVELANVLTKGQYNDWAKIDGKISQNKIALMSLCLRYLFLPQRRMATRQEMIDIKKRIERALELDSWSDHDVDDSDARLVSLLVCTAQADGKDIEAAVVNKLAQIGKEKFGNVAINSARRIKRYTDMLERMKE